MLHLLKASPLYLSRSLRLKGAAFISARCLSVTARPGPGAFPDRWAAPIACPCRYGLYSSPFDPVLFDLEVSGSSCKNAFNSSIGVQSDEIDLSDILSGKAPLPAPHAPRPPAPRSPLPAPRSPLPAPRATGLRRSTSPTFSQVRPRATRPRDGGLRGGLRLRLDTAPTSAPCYLIRLFVYAP